jgi:hypothetical protein
MKSGVRVIKRGREEVARSLPPGRDEKTSRQSEREIVSTVKSWINEWETRRRLDAQSSFALVR